MATDLTVSVNYGSSDIAYGASGAQYIDMDLTNDYLIWTEGDSTVKDLMTHEPTASELNDAATIIDPSSDTQVNLLLLMDYSHDVGGSYYTHEVYGMGDNVQHVIAFRFDGATASEPQLEAWDDSDHDSYDNHVLGNGTPADSMVYAICTTSGLPGASWTGTAIAGSSNVVQLNDGSGAISAPASGSTQDLYANLRIEIPAGYSTPATETFVTVCRYTWS